MFYITDWRLTDKVDYSSMYLRKLQGNYLSIGKNSRGFTYTVCDANTGEFIEGLSLNDLKTLYQEDELIGFYPEYTKSRILIVKCNITQAKLLNEIKFLERKSLDTPDDFPKITCIVENFSNFVFRLETGLGNTNSFTLFDLFLGYYNQDNKLSQFIRTTENGFEFRCCTRSLRKINIFSYKIKDRQKFDSLIAKILLFDCA